LNRPLDPLSSARWTPRGAATPRRRTRALNSFLPLARPLSQLPTPYRLIVAAAYAA
jgi:hypothetical protein